MWRSVRSHAPMAAFHLADVRPAIAARRKAPGEDVISHLLAEGYREPAILIECVTYGAAGMATTREFISMTVLHLLADADLRARYLAGEEEERFDILHEILRLEPIIGHLYRRAARDLDLTVDGEGIGPEVMSFGDGHHKCPGNSLAIQETDILLTRLLRHELVVAKAPVMHWEDLTAGYALRDFVLTTPKPPLPVLAVRDEIEQPRHPRRRFHVAH